MRRITKRVGTGMTASTKRSTSYSPKDPDDVPKLLEALRAMHARFADPWAKMHDLAKDFQRRLEEREGEQADVPYFGERAGAGWYLQKLIMHEKLVRHHISAGSADWAAFEAMIFGNLLSEMLMKFEHESLWERGRDDKEARSRGGGWNRKATIDEKVEAYRKYRAAGNGKDDANYLAAQELGVAESNIRAARKCAGASD